MAVLSAPVGSPALAVETWGLRKTFTGNPPNENRAWLDAAMDGIKALVHPPKQRTVVDGVSLNVRQGEFFGLIGANGAGKTTFLKLLCCLLQPDGGGGRVNGHDLLRERSAVRRSVGLAPAGSYLGILWQLTGRENLLFRARMGGLPRREGERRADYVLERLGIAHKAHERSWNWSAGERQKFALAMVFIARTPLVMLDEPTSHLDPHVARLVRAFVKDELNRRNGQTILMSTHYLEEAELLCDRVAILHEGKLLACDTPARLIQTTISEPILELSAVNYAPELGRRAAAACAAGPLLEHFEDVVTGQARLRPQGPPGSVDPDRLQRALAAEGVTVTAVRRVAATLDDVYFHLTRKQAA